MTTTKIGRPPRNVKPRKPRPKPERMLRLPLAPTADGKPGVLDLSIGKDFCRYYLTVLPCEFGRAFRLDKVWSCDDGDYDVLLADDGRHQCECLGFLHHGRCKHLGALAKLCELGLLPVALPSRQEARGSTQTADGLPLAEDRPAA